MSNSQKITQMVVASLPLSGAELVPIVQDGVNKQAQVSQFISNNLMYQGVWDATANSPALASGVGTSGHYYIVNVAGNTTLDGNTGWQVGDWVIFSDTGVWQKIGGGTLSSLQIADDNTGNVNYNIALTNVSSGLVNTEYVDNSDLTYNPSTKRLSTGTLTVTTGRGFTLGGAVSALYYEAVGNRVTMANYNAGGKLVFEVNGGSYTATFGADGSYTFNNLYGTTVSASPRSVYVDSSGKIGYVSSTKESKTNIAPIADVDWVSKLNPVSFNRRKTNEDGTYANEAYEDKVYGLIAEEVETVNPDLCMYDGNKLVGVNYDQLVVPLLKKIQELEARLAAIEVK